MKNALDRPLAGNQRSRRSAGHLYNKLCDEVVSRIRDADSILILGRGDAEVESKARRESEASGSRIVGIEAIDTMSDRQLTATARSRFLEKLEGAS